LLSLGRRVSVRYLDWVKPNLWAAQGVHELVSDERHMRHVDPEKNA